MFRKTAQYYDEIYSTAGKDYARETGRLVRLIQKYQRTEGNALLDVACGTGVHAGMLREHFRVEGLDLDPTMLKVARKKNPGIRFHEGNMTDFDLKRRFDVLTCLFSAIGYTRTRTNLRKAIATMSRHLLPGGVLIIEPWFTPEQWNRGRVYALQVERPGLKIIRMSYSGQRGRVAMLEFQYLIGTPAGIKHEVELHELGLFTHEEYMEAFHMAGLDATHDRRGLSGRGLYIGRKPATKA